jgi:hypothetical protein
MSSACFPELARLSSSSTNSKGFSGIFSIGCMGFEIIGRDCDVMGFASWHRKDVH